MVICHGVDRPAANLMSIFLKRRHVERRPAPSSQSAGPGRHAGRRHARKVQRRGHATTEAQRPQRPVDGATDDDVQQYTGADDEGTAPQERRQQPVGERREYERANAGTGDCYSCRDTDITESSD